MFNDSNVCMTIHHGVVLFFSLRYKILFLDVLFPLSVDKFIFVDADQVSARLLRGFVYLFICTLARILGLH